MKPKKLQPSFGIVLQDFVAWLEKSAVKGVIIGGVAVSLLSKPRTTQDIDVLILLEQDKWTEFFELGEKFGFQERISNAIQFAKKNRVLLMRHTSGIDIEMVLLAHPKLDKKRIKKWVQEFAEVLENPEIDHDLRLLLKASSKLA